MKKIALILALAFPLSVGMALTTSFAFGLLPLRYVQRTLAS